jgi:hypothetical protein
MWGELAIHGRHQWDGADMTLVRGIENICNKTHTHEDTTPYQHIHPTENVECIVDEKHLAHGESPPKSLNR